MNNIANQSAAITEAARVEALKLANSALISGVWEEQETVTAEDKAAALSEFFADFS